MKRLLPEKAFPAYIFIPGENPHPKKSGGHMEGEGDPVSEPIDINHPERCEFLRYSIDLLNYGYYWESHVYFESLWNAHGRKGSVADFLKGMIKLGAAGVKLKIGQNVSAEGHFLRARELFNSVMQAEGQIFLGFNLSDIISKIDEAMSSQNKNIVICPLWD